MSQNSNIVYIASFTLLILSTIIYHIFISTLSYFIHLKGLCNCGDLTNSYNGIRRSHPRLDFCLLNLTDTPLFFCYLSFFLYCFLLSSSDTTLRSCSLPYRGHTFCSTSIIFQACIYSIGSSGRCSPALVFYTEHALLYCSSCYTLHQFYYDETNVVVVVRAARRFCYTNGMICVSSSYKL